ncbi:MAG: protein translocase subunit SecD [Spirochaetota bacterium]
MTQRNLTKMLIILAVTVFSVILILPTVGVNVLEIQLSDTTTAAQIESLKKRFPADAYSFVQDEKTVQIEGYGINNAVMNEVLKKEDYPCVNAAKILPHWAEKAVLAKRINLGLDLQGGSMLVLEADYPKMEKKLNRTLSEKEKTEVLNQAYELLPGRIDPHGILEPQIRIRGNEAIEVQLPGIRDPKAVKNAIGMTGRVEYRLDDPALSAKAEQFMTANSISFAEDYSNIDEVRAKIAAGINLPADREVLFQFERDENTKKLFPGKPLVLETKISLAGTDISLAAPGYDDYGRLGVNFTTTSDGATKFAEATSKKNHGRRLAIVIDNQVRSAPSLNVQINGGKAVIEGSFTQEEVDMLVRIIKEGSLPVDLRIVEERSVGPSLGQDAIDAGIKAGIVAIAAIAIFMIAYYKFAGVISIIGLILNAVYALAMLSWLGFTLTLPGLAGFVLTLGVAIDANVIIYERIREELRAGKTVRVAVNLGFDRAFWTIFDSNLTTVLAALILTFLGSGPIKGYAVTLTIGIIANMFVALYVTKWYYMVTASRTEKKKLSI